MALVREGFGDLRTVPGTRDESATPIGPRDDDTKWRRGRLISTIKVFYARRRDTGDKGLEDVISRELLLASEEQRAAMQLTDDAEKLERWFQDIDTENARRAGWRGEWTAEGGRQWTAEAAWCASLAPESHQRQQDADAWAAYQQWSEHGWMQTWTPDPSDLWSEWRRRHGWHDDTTRGSHQQASGWSHQWEAKEVKWQADDSWDWDHREAKQVKWQAEESWERNTNCGWEKERPWHGSWQEPGQGWTWG
mmetsp:Transcript_48259/g.140690  ORF Transcript_48259/g.140690 Transcript_48259/m.140690 type:complete len:250 (+) Transcript_48259:609-1358(+)